MYAIQKNDGSGYVARPGSKRSYTSDIGQAKRFKTEEDAKKECCGNERVVDLFDHVFGGPYGY